MHKPIAVLVYSCVLSMCAFDAVAACQDANHLLVFGRFELGEDRSSLPEDIEKVTGCEENPQNNYYYCEYIDVDGVHYIVEGHLIVRKYVPDLSSYRGRQLVGGIARDDTIEDVLRKFRSLPSNFPTWMAFSSIEENIESFHLVTHECLQADKGYPWYYEVVFSKDGKLIAVNAGFSDTQ